MKSSAKFCQLVQEFDGRDLCVEGIRVLELLVPIFIDNYYDEASAGIFGRLVELTVIS